MQRKNYILKKRPGFAMIMAIFMMVLIAGMMAAAISMSSTTTNRTQDDYLHEQAQLIARSATEYAVLAISGHEVNVNQGCINTINMVYPTAANPMFNIRVDMQYILFYDNAAGVRTAYNCNPITGTGGVAQTNESNGTVLMDVTVTSNNGLNIPEPIRYERRTLQKL
ncbi:type II secretion system protein [Sulfuricurvum sp.]|uniref:type II secretion system protein n=1 Tax=Sulfuricurvum sp. TaxID=2025608 RepID=UPI002D29D564|nr:type II secretion system protein [Sulfuricurvum sp.]HZF69814.1 type II secretion system protein [Sulfuricurvum sp.]